MPRLVSLLKNLKAMSQNHLRFLFAYIKHLWLESSSRALIHDLCLFTTMTGFLGWETRKSTHL